MRPDTRRGAEEERTGRDVANVYPWLDFVYFIRSVCQPHFVDFGGRDGLLVHAMKTVPQTGIPFELPKIRYTDKVEPFLPRDLSVCCTLRLWQSLFREPLP